MLVRYVDVMMCRRVIFRYVGGHLILGTVIYTYTMQSVDDHAQIYWGWQLSSIYNYVYACGYTMEMFLILLLYINTTVHRSSIWRNFSYSAQFLV